MCNTVYTTLLGLYFFDMQNNQSEPTTQIIIRDMEHQHRDQCFYNPELQVERQESNPQFCPASELNLILLLLSELRIIAQGQVMLVSHQYDSQCLLEGVNLLTESVQNQETFAQPSITFTILLDVAAVCLKHRSSVHSCSCVPGIKSKVDLKSDFLNFQGSNSAVIHSLKDIVWFKKKLY